jgi:hypothetical protein
MYWRLVDLRAFLVSDPYEISGFSEGWLFGADALSDELRVLSCFLPGHTLMSRHVTGSVFPDKIEEKSLHLRKTAHFADGERRFHAMVSRYFARS